MPTATQYINRLQFHDRLIKRFTEGLNHEDTMKQMSIPVNCMNWNLGHLLVYRMQYLGAIDGASQPGEAEFVLYGAGSKPLTDSDKAIPLESLLTRLDDASAQIISALETMPPGKLAEIYDSENDTTVDDRLHFYLSFHEAYHLGQIEMLRELALANS